jgi:glycosyltransferase involved in cell wall biosynthesis
VRRILMTLDAVGGVWRYAMDLCRTLAEQGAEFVLVGLGPEPSVAQGAEAEKLAGARLLWLDEPLDWTVQTEDELDRLPARLSALAKQYDVDLIHLNLPSQACGLYAERPMVAVSHSCVVSWWHTVRRTELPGEWNWQGRRNRRGFDTADLVVAPTASHADLIQLCYGPIEALKVVYNGAAATFPASAGKEPSVFAAARWWDEGKNGRVLDAAAGATRWPIAMAGSRMGPQGQNITFSNARVAGELPHDQLLELIGRAGIVASPSLYEPFGLVPLEAARAKAALVLSDIPTYRELWDGVAVFADPHDPAAFANAINSLAADRGWREELGERAAERAGRLSLQTQAEAMLEAYDEAFLRHAKRQPATAA